MTVEQEEKELHVQLWQESSMSKRAYARENGINRNTFYGWCRKDKAKGKTEDHKLVEVPIGRTRNQNTGERSGSITLQTANGYHLKIINGFEPQLLQELLDVLEVR